jgi:signal transduction histidine kinase
MNFNLISNLQTCYEFINSNPTTVTLIHYTHWPVIIISIFVGIIILLKNKDLLSWILFLISFFFSLWAILDLIIWLNTNTIQIMTAWSMFWIVNGMVATLSFYFAYVFIFKRDITFWAKILLLLIQLPIFILTPTSLNLLGFDLINCEAVENPFFLYYYYTMGFLTIVGILSLLFIAWKKIDKSFRREVVLLVIGLEAFLILFYSLSGIASYLDNYNIEFYGLFGKVIFIVFLAYLIVRFKTFNIKLIGTQALVWASIILIGSQYFFIQTNINRILTGFTIVLFTIVGWLIVRSVKKEIRQKQEIEHLLKIKSEFIDIVSHQLRTPVSVIKGMASMLKEGDLDNAPKEQRDQFIAGIYEKSEKLADILNDILKAAELDMDNFTFTPASIKSINLSQLVKGIFDDLTSLAQAKKLNYQIKISPEIASLNVMTDESFLKHVFQNVTDNAIKYSKEGGSMTVDLSKEKDFFICKITDSGIGIPEDQKDRLFEKFFRAKNAVDAHAYGTGLGLFITRKIVQAHPGGKIWFDSVVNKGTTFYIKLPIAKQA